LTSFTCKRIFCTVFFSFSVSPLCLSYPFFS